MKSFLALALFVGVALGAGSLSSTGFFGWSPNQELVYRFESEVLSGLPEIRRDQYAGLKIASEVLVQTKGDYSLIVKFAEPKFIVVNGELRMREGRPLVPAPEQEVPEHLRRYLTQPFLVHLKRGIVERFFVEENEPVVVTNIKKSLLAQVQMDLTASRRQDLLKTNMIPTGSEKEILEGGLEGKTFFTTEETTLNGDCQVDYNMWPMPKYQSHSLEAQWTEEEKELRKMNVLKGIQSQGEEICRGKQYWTIVKTENFDNCRQRPVFVSGKGAKIACEPSKAECKDIFTMTSSSKYIVCGTPERFTIREIVSENTGVFNPLAINTEKTINNARVTLFLVKAKTSGSFTPLTPVSGGQAKEKKSLIMEYPLKSEWSSESSIKTFSGEEEVEEFTPLRPVPSLHTPDFVYPSSMTPSEIKQEVIHKMEEIVNSIYSGSETENSGMGSKTAAKIGAIVTELRYLNSEELRSLVSELESILSNGEEVKKVIGKQLLHDILSTVGTNPAVILVKEELQRGNVHLKQRIQVVQTLIRDVRTPTKEILKELVHLVKTLKGNGPSNIFYTAINQLSTLFYRACVDTSSAVSTYPVRIYGRFCTKESSVLTEEYIPYLTGELERVESRGQRLAILSALGKTGSKKALLPITKAIEGHSSTTPIIRSLAVYSLRRIAKQEPTIVKPIILALIDNLAENTEVRIAAVSVLPYCQPSVAELQKIAIRSWFEPSKQVTSFIYSTLKGLPETEVPELKPVGLKCKKVLSLVKPSQFGIQFSHNTHFVNFIKSLRLGGGLKTTMVKTAESLIPSRTSVSFDLYGAGIWEVKRLDHTIYTQGMDTILEKVIALVDGNEVSSEVESELRHIKEKLNIKPRGVIRGEETPEIFSQFRMFDLERISHIKLSDIVEEVASNLRSGSRYGSEHVTVVGMVMPINGEILMPTIAGFPLYLQTITPLVYGSKTTSLSKFSSGIAIKAMPTSNLLVNSNIGVRCPLTKQFIGSGVEMSVHMSLPLEVSAEINNRLQLAVTLKAPKEVRGDIELLSTKVHAYTIVKDCKRITTVEEATNLKEVRTGKPVHKMTYPIGHKAGIHSKVEIATDYKVYDFAYIMNLIKEEGIVGQGLLPKTLKYFNTRITFNPALSDTKEIKMTFNMVTGRTTESGLEMIRPGLLSGLTSGIESGIESGLQSGLQSSLQSGIELESLRTPEGIKSEIHSICKEHHTSSYKVERCIAKHENVEEELSLIQTEKNEIEEICSEHGSEEEKVICRKGLKVCHKAKVICEEQSSPLHCAEKKDECIGLKRSTEKMMVVSNKLRMEHELEQGLEFGRINGEKLEGLVSGIAIHTSLKQEYGNKKSVNVVLVGGYTQKGRTVRTTAELVCKASETPRFEVELLTTTRLPEVLFRWNLPALLEQPIEMSIDAELKFGRVGEPKTKVAVHSLLKKSEQQKKEVRASPEYKKCEQEERESRPLSPVCMETRHQAASVDFIRTTVLFPSNVMERSPLMTKIGNGLKSTILSNLVLFRSHGEQQEEFEESTPYYPGSGSLVASGEEQRMTVETIFSRDGSAANLTLTTGGSEQILLRLKNVRVPQLVSGLMPLSVRNGITTRLVQKVSRDQAPASCSVDHSFVNTFDNRTYGYKVNECEHLLFKDCSGMRPVAVTASKVGGNSKKVTVLAGSHKVVMKPSSTLGGAVDIFVDGRLERISHNEEYTKVSPVSGKITLKIYRHKDGVVSVTNPIEKLTVFFDNKRIEIVAPQRFHNRACGLCGDLNQENTADLKSPEKCLFSKDRFAAYSYSMKNERCSGVVPSEDKSIFEHELRECVKGRTVITPVTGLSRRLLESSPKPTAVRHLIHEETNRVCLSKKLQKVCPSSGPGSRGSQSAEVTMPFTCFTKPSSKAEQLVKRAEAGEVLSTVMTRPTMFSKKMVITLTCGEEPFLSGKAVFGGVASGNYRTSERRGF